MAEPQLNPLLARVLGEGEKLTLERLRDYLAVNRRNAESLVTASRLTGDLAMLREAVTKFPSDARAQFELANRSPDAAERERAAQALIAADPENAMGSYMAAIEAFKAGRNDDAVTMLGNAATSVRLDDYWTVGLQSAEEAYVSAGYTATEAKVAAFSRETLPQTMELNGLSQQIEALRKAYAGAGDEASAQSMLTMGLNLGQQVQQSLGGKKLISDLVGQAIESRFLKTLDPATVVDASGVTAQHRMDQIAERKQLIKRTMQGVDPMAANIDPQVLSQFLDRQKILGELAALQWLRGRLGLDQK